MSLMRNRKNDLYELSAKPDVEIRNQMGSLWYE